MLRRAAALAAACLGFISPAPLRADEVVRILAGNISSGSNQAYEGPGNRILQGLKPDIALLQELEVGSKSTAEYRAWVNEQFGSTFSYYVESAKNIPNGIVSRYPILNSGSWDDAELSDREFAWAKIDIPGDKNLLAVSVHLKASSGGDNETRRNNQATALVSLINANLTAGDFLVIGGDCNTYSRSEACIQTLSAVVKTTAPYPADQDSNSNTNSGQTSPYDWVMPSNNLAAYATPLVIGSNTHTNGLVFDSRDYTPLSAVSPVQSGDSGATGMQHMAVMRAFLIPTNVAPVITQGSSVSVTLSANNSPTAFSRSLDATDADGNPLTWSIQTAASHGSAGVIAPASGGTVNLSYTPATNYTGSDSFIVRVSDGQGGTDSITVNLTVQAPPPPVISGAGTVSFTRYSDDPPLGYVVSATAGTPTPLQWSLPSAPAHGQVVLTPFTTGQGVSVSYTPTSGYLGSDTFTFRATDAFGGTASKVVNINIIEHPNNAPVINQGTSVPVTLSQNNTPTPFSCSLAAADSDSDPLTWSIATPAAHGTAGIVAPATGSSVNLSYQPTANYTGSDSFVVQVSDGRGGTDTVAVQLTVAPAPALDAWTYSAFAPLTAETEATVWGENADADQDGYTNLEEFAHGLNPKLADKAPNLMSCALTGQGEDRHAVLSFKIRMDGANPALAYTLEHSDELWNDWQEILVDDLEPLGDVDLGGGFISRSVRVDAPVRELRAYRLVFQRP